MFTENLKSGEGQTVMPVHPSPHNWPPGGRKRYPFSTRRLSSAMIVSVFALACDTME